MSAAVSRSSKLAVEIYSDSDALRCAGAERIVRLAADSIFARGRFTIALAGGATPRPAYELLAQPPLAAQIEWSRVHVFWGDERCVPPEHEDSNYRMARLALLDRVAIPVANVHRIAGESDPHEAARAYEEALRAFFARPAGPPQRSFDLALLGMGDDGHTASLFPGTAPVVEQTRWVMANHIDAPHASWRITLTPVVLNASSHIVFLVAGASKAMRLAQAIEHTASEPLPVERIRPARGDVIWMMDAAAATHLAAPSAHVQRMRHVRTQEKI